MIHVYLCCPDSSPRMSMFDKVLIASAALHTTIHMTLAKASLFQRLT